MMSSRPSLLLTGASGVLGRALLDQLADDYDVTCLRHRTPIGDPRVTELHGDLTQPKMGLSEHQYQTLRSVDVIVHCGATTQFSHSPEHVHATNVQGTAAVLDLAASGNVRLVHVSTAFVSRSERLAEAATPLNGPAGAVLGRTPSVYLASKVATEAMVRDSGLDALVVRPAVIVGDSLTGEISTFQGLHQLFGAVLTGTVPLLPVSGTARVDFIPQDVAARALARLLAHGDTGRTYWLSAGEHAPTVADLLEATAGLAAELGLTEHRPRLVSADMVGRLLVPLMAETLPAKLQRSFANLLSQATLFQDDLTFPSCLADLGPDLVLDRAELVAVFTRSMAYWAQARGLQVEAVA
jgi:nucleoside-diphosphate-sugar epimerase